MPRHSFHKDLGMNPFVHIMENSGIGDNAFIVSNSVFRKGASDEIKGLCEKILRVDLSGSKMDIEDLNEELARQFVGGSGPGAQCLHEMTVLRRLKSPTFAPIEDRFCEIVRE